MSIAEVPMTTAEGQRGSTSRLRDTLREDLRQKDLWASFLQEMRDLKEFYLDDAQKKLLDQMNPFKRFFLLSWWILKGMFLKLTPIRRLLLLVGVLFILISVGGQRNGRSADDWRPLLGGGIIILVLMLELKDRLLVRDELEAARRVQQALMPPKTPSVPGWSVWLSSRPANEVGGDLVDFISIADSRHGLVLADVTGKGLRAALLMAKLQATLRALAPDFSSAARLATKVNEIFHRDSLPNMFASMLYMEIRPDSGAVRCVNAGHLPPFLLRGVAVEELSKGEAAIGLMPGTSYTEHDLSLERGDFCIAYSDGLTEAVNQEGEFFGTKRLFSTAQACRTMEAPEMGQALLTEIDRFIGKAKPFDDLSIIILKRV
jgi:serine phosphatase RsbU (regulator of sigma subunit)